MGKLKVSVTTNLNIRKVMEQEPGEHSGINNREGVPYSSDIRLANQVLNEPAKRNFSFGGVMTNQYANNPYPSQPQT